LFNTVWVFPFSSENLGFSENISAFLQTVADNAHAHIASEKSKQQVCDFSHFTE